MHAPNDLLYTKSHEWIRIEGPEATVGITAFAVEQLGDVTLIELPEVGAQLTAGGSMGTIESVKAVSDLYAPCAGTVTAVNPELEAAPEKVNDDPYGEGWLVRMTVGDAANTDNLMDAAAYQAYLDSLD